MARVVLVSLCLCWALGPAAASAPPNILLLLMDDVSRAGGPAGGRDTRHWGSGARVAGRKSLGGVALRGAVRVDGGDVGHWGGGPVCGQEGGRVPVPIEGLVFLGRGRCG